MGVLDIRYRSATLGNIGGVSSVVTPNLMGLAEGGNRVIGDLGNGLAQGARDISRMAMAIKERRDKVRFDGFMNSVEQETNKLMLGDGGENKGLYREDFTDSKEWAERIKTKREEIVNRLLKEYKINTSEWREVLRPRMSGFDQQWDVRIMDRAFKVEDDNAKLNSTERRKQAEDNLSFGDGTNESYTDWKDAVENEIRQHHIADPETAALMRRRSALNLVMKQFENSVKLCASECSEMEDRKEVEKHFSEVYNFLKNEKGEYDFGNIVRHKYVQDALGERGLSGLEKSFEADWNNAKRVAIRKAESNQRIRRADDARAADEAQIAILNSVPKPDTDDHRELAAYHAKRSAAYTSFLSSPEGLRLKDTFPARYKAMSIMAQDERVDAGVETRKGNGERFLSMLADGFVGQHEITPAEIQATADDLLVSEQISRDDYDKAIRFKKKALTPKAKALHDMIFADKEVKFPEMCRWQESFGQFEIPNTKAGAKAASTKMKLTSKKNPWWFDDTETRLYSEIVKGANYAMEYMEANNCTVEQAYKEFVEITRGTTEDLAKLAYEERLERRKDMLGEFRAAGPNRKASFARKVLEQ